MIKKIKYLAVLVGFLALPIKFASAACDNCPDKNREYQCLKCADRKCEPSVLQNLYTLFAETSGTKREDLLKQINTEKANFDTCINKCEAKHDCDWTKID